jgi:mono/diheme cytochrome c family protein
VVRLVASRAVLIGLTSGQKLGLLAAAAVFIGFSIAASFLFPRRNPDWPGRRLGSFVALTLLLFLGMLTAVFLLAKEEEEAAGHGATATATSEDEAEEGPGAGETPTGETGGAGEVTGEGTTTGGGGAGGGAGDAEAGKAVFASAQCGSCHTLADAGTNGQIGPNLDESRPSYELTVDRVTNGKPPMPAFKDQLSEQQIRDVSAYVAEASGGS